MPKQLHHFIGFFCLLFANQLFAANYYWVGMGGTGSGDYNTKACWRLGSITGSIPTLSPTSTDNVYFTAAAFGSSAATITLDSDGSCKDMIWDAALPNNVLFRGSNSQILEIFGDLTLAQSQSTGGRLKMNLKGILRMMGGTPLVKITTRGCQMDSLTVFRIGSSNSSSTEFRLEDDLKVGHATGSASFNSKVFLVNGLFNTNNKNLSCNAFYSATNQSNGNAAITGATRGLNISNSVITLWGLYYDYSWYVDFQSAATTGTTATGVNYSQFTTTNSKIILGGIGNRFWGGFGLSYDWLDAQQSCAVGFFRAGTNAAPINTQFNRVDFAEGAAFTYGVCRVTINDLYVKRGFTYQFPQTTRLVISGASSTEQQLEIGTLHTTTGCGVVTFSTVSEYYGFRTRIKKKTSGNFLVDGFILIDVSGDIANGSTYTANNSLLQFGSSNPSNWTATGTTTAPSYYFIGKDSITASPTAFTANKKYANWNDLDNWRYYTPGAHWTIPGTIDMSTIPTCLPGATNDVYFGAQSFPALAANNTLSQGIVLVDTIVTCRDMYWMPDVQNQTTIAWKSTTNDHTLNVYGSAYFDEKMRIHYGLAGAIGIINFYNISGRAQDTIAGGKSFLNSVNYLKLYANYVLKGDGDATTMDWTTGYLMQEVFSTVKASDVQFSLKVYSAMGRNFHNTQVYFVGNAYPANYSEPGSGAAYAFTGNTTYHIYGDTVSRPIVQTYIPPAPYATSVLVPHLQPRTNIPTYIMPIGSGHFPNMVTYMRVGFGGTAGTAANGSDLVNNCYIKGDLFAYENMTWGTANGTGKFNIQSTTANTPSFTGSLSLLAGRQYTIFESGANSYMKIAGKLLVDGSCINGASLSTDSGLPVEFTVSDATGSSVKGINVQGMNAVNSSAAISAQAPSVDGGNNTNWVFTSSVATTYYWRAHGITPTQFNGNWSNPCHWTTNKANLVGDCNCVPSLLDSVVIDTMSSAGGLGNDTLWLDGTGSQCRSLVFVANKIVRSVSNSHNLNIALTLRLHTNMPKYDYYGEVVFMGNKKGELETKNTPVRHSITINNPNGVWELVDNLKTEYKVSTYTSIFKLLAGTFDTKNKDMIIVGALDFGNDPSYRNFILGTSTLTDSSYSEILANTSIYWSVANTNNLTISGRNSLINIVPNVSRAVSIYDMGENAYSNTISLGRVNILDRGLAVQLTGNISYRRLNITTDAQIKSSAQMDTLEFTNDHFYRFDANTVQTLASPYGTILTPNVPGSYVNIETTNPTPDPVNMSRFHKAYGTPICIYNVKVKENVASREADTTLIPVLPTDTVNWRTEQTNLFFNALLGSDNINGTALDKWRFNLPLAISPTVTTPSPYQACGLSTVVSIPLSLVGNSPYYVSYQWVNSVGFTSALFQETVLDDDNDGNTPFVYTITITAANSTTVTANMYTVRCAREYAPTRIIEVLMPNPSTLVNTNQATNCYSANSPQWLTFYDQTPAKNVILSIQDQINAGDVDELKNVNVSVTFTPSVQYCNSTPFLQRQWIIKPENNQAANVRLYFTQAELDNLRWYTQVYPGTLNPATQIQVRKFESGVVCSGASMIIPHTVTAWTPATSAPFTTGATTGVIAIDIQVPSFSAFIIEPTPLAVLPLQLLSFEATLNTNKQTDLVWTTADESNVRHYKVQRSQDAVNFTDIAEVQAQNRSNNSYKLVDKNPLNGFNYYRIVAIEHNQIGSISDLRQVELEGTSILDIFPVPTQVGEDLTIRFNSTVAQTYEVQVVDALGRILSRQNQDLQAGVSTMSINTQNLSAGMYWLRIQNGNAIAQRTFILK